VKTENKEKMKNKFIHDGNITDYENRFNKKIDTVDKDLSYAKYKELLNRTPFI
jgi:hypothetical protein